MSFKKKSIKVKKTDSFFSNFIGTISIIIIFFIGSLLVKAVSNINFDNFITPNIEIIETTNPQDKNINSNKINILIVGRGGGDHDAPDLTDTIILASIDIKENIVSMLSIPRDLYVEYDNGETGKINEIYRKFTKSYGTKNLGMKSLESKVTQITGEKIDFYINVDFEGFIQIIDTFGGVDIEVPEKFVDKKYPDGKGGYTTFMLKKGNWTLDGEVALKFVRSRHSTSDFDRSIRQQQVIASLKDKIAGQGLFKNTKNLKKLYNILSEYVITDLNLENILKLRSFSKNNKNLKILSFNLNDSCFYGTDLCQPGGFLYIPQREFYEGLSVLLPYGAEKGKLNNYTNLKKFSSLIFNSRDIYTKKVKINIFNSLKVNFLASETADKMKKYGFNIPEKNSIGNTKNIFKESIIYYNNIEENSQTLKAIKSFYTGKIEKKDKIVYAEEEDVKIEIIIGEDYEKVFSF